MKLSKCALLLFSCLPVLLILVYIILRAMAPIVLVEVVKKMVFFLGADGEWSNDLQVRVVTMPVLILWQSTIYPSTW